MDDFYAARTANAAALPWTNIAPPFTDVTDNRYFQHLFTLQHNREYACPLYIGFSSNCTRL